MKKFLAYLLVIVLCVSLGFAVFYLVRDNEVISLSTTTLYKDAGSTFELSLDMKKNNSYTKIEVTSSDEDVLSISDKEINVKKGVARATFKANKGGAVRVNFQTNNSKFRNLYCDITIGDGSKENPFFISTPEQLNSIGKTLESGENIYTLNSSYELVDDIDVSKIEGSWTPLGTEATPFTGSFNGNGYTIYNMIIDGVNKNLGLFSNIGASGDVENIKFDNVKVIASETTENIGCVAGINEGTIERIEVKNFAVENEFGEVCIGGIAGQNISSPENVSSTHARISRSSVNLDFYGKLEDETKTPVSGIIGGITGKNIGSTVINCYTKGAANLGSGASYYGGIVGLNEYVENESSSANFEGDFPARIKDCYTLVKCDTASYNAMTALVGALVGDDVDSVDEINKIMGLYYKDDCIATTIYGIGGETSNEALVATKLTDAKMKEMASYKSYIEKVPYVENGEVKYKDGETISWNKQVWSIVDKENDGYPVINFTAMNVSDGFQGDSFEILPETPEELNQKLLDNINNTTTELTITRDYDLTGYNWIPVGTVENPFQGKINVAYNEEEGRYYTIKGLTITQTVTNGHAGMFGAIGESATIKNIHLEDVMIANADYTVAGSLVAYNGWEKGKGGAIINCTVENGAINAKNIVGGLVGYNDGSVEGCRVVGGNPQVDNVAQDLKTITIEATSKEEAWVGGIAGQNDGTITGIITEGQLEAYTTLEGYVIIKCSDGIIKSVQMGGIAGSNNGTIEFSKVSVNYKVNETTYGIKSGYYVKAYIGGIAGYSTGLVSNTSASININSSTSEEGYVGGIIGWLDADNDTNAKHNLRNSISYNSEIIGYNVGGLVGYMTDKNPQSYEVEDNYLSKLYAEKLTIDSDTYSTSLKLNVYASAVEKTTTLRGKNVGGFACVINAGVVYDCYSHAILAGETNAGFVYEIKFNSSAQTGGLMTRCYALLTFEGGSTNYQVSSSGIHLESSLKNRTAGFIDDYYYAIEKDNNSKQPDYNANVVIWAGNIFNGGDNKTFVRRLREKSALEDSDMWGSFTSENSLKGTSVWKVTDGSLPTIPAAENNK